MGANMVAKPRNEALCLKRSTPGLGFQSAKDEMCLAAEARSTDLFAANAVAVCVETVRVRRADAEVAVRDVGTGKVWRARRDADVRVADVVAVRRRLRYPGGVNRRCVLGLYQRPRARWR